ncbi:ATP-binding protein [Nocardioides sp. Soil805]|uniref:ATP-binding protein n=1 Tax=Nocardioides sp. Soil805 TaxID=1736416 RepID=UPI000703A722|nr:ATP-binding protein [Nocardioides sp. Soil805]KRF34158.1 hypothetical protein ASG94_15625 [Nocardioides sp. Soil805]
MSGAATVVDLALPAEPRTAARARRAVREALQGAGAAHLGDVAELVVSELVTNAVVHAGTPIGVRVVAEPTALRVEVQDGSDRMPVRRAWAETSGTGRGLRIVDEHADRWGVERTDAGKVVWFEVGRPTTPVVRRVPAPDGSSGDRRIDITLRSVPLLMHWAWQEHAATLLREYLLYALDRDVRALDDHAAASSALSLLDEQVPRPRLPSEPDALMASSVEPAVTAAAVSLSISAAAVRHFEVLDDLLVRARAAAEDGRLLSPPTQPEMAEMRAWLCGEVAGQAEGAAEPKPWRARTDVRVARRPDQARPRAVRALLDTDQPLIAMDDASVIVAVSAEVVEHLGYRREEDLLGRRILVVVPARFHQAHIAGTTLHATHGRDVLLDRWLDVPMVRADGTEVPVGLHVQARRLDGDVQVFVAHVRF